MTPSPRPALPTGQSGALFGLDARIALAVFSVISVVAGAAMVVNLDSTSAQALAGELTDTSRAIEAFHEHVKTDIYQALDKPSTRTAFEALFDQTVISEDGNLRGRWNGPYIKFTSARHAKYGEMMIKKQGADHTTACDDGNLCYLWLTYTSVRKSIVDETNELLDGPKEPNAATSGRVQWSPGERNNVQLHFRAARALTPFTE